MDERLKTALAAAQEKISALIGGPVAGELVVAYYEHFAESMECEGVRTSRAKKGHQRTASVAVQYYNATDKAVKVLQSDAWLDPTGFVVRVSGPFLSAARYSPRRANPVAIAWSKADGANMAGVNIRTEAILTLAAAFVHGENVDQAIRTAHLMLGGTRMAA